MNRVSGKIKVARERKWISYTPLLVRYIRNFHGKTGYEEVYRFPCIRDYQVKEKAAEFWERFDILTDRMVEEGIMWRNWVIDAEKKIAKVIPRPIAAPSIAPQPARVLTPEMNDIRTRILAKYNLA